MELPFNTFTLRSKLPKCYKMTLDLACTLEVMTRFGRPLSVLFISMLIRYVLGYTITVQCEISGPVKGDYNTG